MYPGGKLEISGSVKAYFALKLCGHDPESEPMQRARRAILDAGGADRVNSYTRYYLALLGQIPYEICPAVPPEAVLLPRWFPINLYAVSSWSRTIIVPLSIISALRPVRRLDPALGIRELFVREPEDWPALRCPGLPGGTGLLSWDRFFRTCDRLLKWCQRHRVLPLRRRAIAAAERWMLERFSRSDGLGAIFPPIIWSALALRCLGYADASPEVCECHRQLEALVLEDEATGTVRLQPCKSPVWDTAIALRSLAAGGVSPDDPAVGRAADWLLSQQVTAPGDWAKTVRGAPGAWCFEYHNDFYPDCDDTAMVLMALSEQYGRPAEAIEGATAKGPLSLRERVGVRGIQVAGECPHPNPLPKGEGTGHPDPLQEGEGPEDTLEWTAAAIGRGVQWLLAMQNHDGGWGAFDRNNDRRFLCYVPFADHNAMIDPSTPDLAARVLEALAMLGRRLGDPRVDRAVAYLRRMQEPDGAWFGRWGVNYIYGTWQVLVGLRAVGVPRDDPAVARGAAWLLGCQHRCGAWGESADSYEDPTLRGQGPPTASQTAWALMGLVAAGLADHPAVVRGVRYLLDRQREDGTWDEPEFTGTGFPRVFYLRYHYYRIYFPLMALGRWAGAASDV